MLSKTKTFLLDPWSISPWAVLAQTTGLAFLGGIFFLLSRENGAFYIGLIPIGIWLARLLTGTVLLGIVKLFMSSAPDRAYVRARNAAYKSACTRLVCGYLAMTGFWLASLVTGIVGGVVILLALRGAGFVIAEKAGRSTFGNTTITAAPVAYGPIISILILVLGLVGSVLGCVFFADQGKDLVKTGWMRKSVKPINGEMRLGFLNWFFALAAITGLIVAFIIKW